MLVSQMLMNKRQRKSGIHIVWRYMAGKSGEGTKVSVSIRVERIWSYSGQRHLRICTWLGGVRVKHWRERPKFWVWVIFLCLIPPGITFS